MNKLLNKNGFVSEGYTLIEMVIVLIIVSIVALVGGFVLFHGFESGYRVKGAIEASWQARTALARMASELREMNLAIDISSNLQFEFNDIRNADITYLLSGNLLQHRREFGLSSITNTLADDITNLNFTYYDVDNHVTTDINALRCIGVSLIVTKIKQSTYLQTTICPRNLT
jgi:prepilin-type N-terminal cleavage/methylation domain-containing protein